MQLQLTLKQNYKVMKFQELTNLTSWNNTLEISQNIQHIETIFLYE